MISRHDMLNNNNLPTTCYICTRHVRWRAMTIQCTLPYIVYAILICIDLNFIKVASFPSVLIRRLARLHQGVIGMIRGLLLSIIYFQEASSSSFMFELGLKYTCRHFILQSLIESRHFPPSVQTFS